MIPRTPMALGTRLADFLFQQTQWSQATFGPDGKGPGQKGPLGAARHLAKEVAEIIADIEAGKSPIGEAADALFLLVDLVRRDGKDFFDLLEACELKLIENKQRTWPDWRTQPADVPIEHVRDSSRDVTNYELPKSNDPLSCGITPSKKRGRPKGSKNKPKPPAEVTIAESGPVELTSQPVTVILDEAENVWAAAQKPPVNWDDFPQERSTGNTADNC